MGGRGEAYQVVFETVDHYQIAVLKHTPRDFSSVATFVRLC